MPAPFAILAKEGIQRAARDVESRFDVGGKRGDMQRELYEYIAAPLAEAATSKATPTLLADYDTYNDYGRKDGIMTAVRAKGSVFVFHQKKKDGYLELRCYEPLAPGDFKLNKLTDGGVGKLYGVKDGGDVARITLDIGSRNVRVYMNGKPQDAIDSQWGHGVAEVALALINRARVAADALVDDVEHVEIEPGVSQERARAKSRPLSDVLVASASASGNRVEPKGIPGHDLIGAESWRGAPLLVTEDRSGGKNVHVLLERRDPSAPSSGKTVLWPVETPDDASFPKKGASMILDGDTLHLFGGVGGGGKVLNEHWTLDMNKASASTSQWKRATPLKDGVAWAAAAVDSRDAFVAGGVAGYYLKRGEGSDEKVLQSKRSMQVGGFGNWRDRASAPSDPTHAHALADKGAVFVGPGVAKDGAVVVYDTEEQAWFALPTLPAKLGMGQLHRSGSSELVYSGGFLADGSASSDVYTLNLDDMFGGWQKKGSSDAVAGGARVVDRFGKKVSFLVGPQGALMVHLE